MIFLSTPHQYYLCHQINDMRWTGHVAIMGEKQNVFRALLWKPEASKPVWKT